MSVLTKDLNKHKLKLVVIKKNRRTLCSQLASRSSVYTFVLFSRSQSTVSVSAMQRLQKVHSFSLAVLTCRYVVVQHMSSFARCPYNT